MKSIMTLMKFTESLLELSVVSAQRIKTAISKQKVMVPWLEI